MDILFLGTSSGWPLPRLGCRCKICSSPNPRDLRLRPSILVNGKILLDAPPDIYHQLTKYKIDSTKITHVLLTHAHDDHIMGLYDLSHIYSNAKVTLVAPKEVLQEARKKLNTSILSFKIVEAKPLQKVDLSKDISATFVPVEHTISAYAIKIKAPRLITYAPEFRRIPPSSRRQIAGCEVVIIDGSSKTSLGQARGHETIEDGLGLGGELNAKRVLFTNIGHKTDRHEALESFVKQRSEGQFYIAFDGLELNV
jgi:phosphoribosyl 1,2-cyclic phosphate phosphodiesterase